jgi:hypothetical protein
MLGGQSGLLRLVVGLIIVVALVGAGYYLITTTEWEGAAGSLEESWPLAEVEEGVIRLQLGVGDLVLEPLEDSNSFAQIRLEGPEEVVFRRDFDRSGDRATLEISGPEWDSPWPFRTGNDIRWYIDLTDQIQLELDIETGVGRSDLDLRTLQAEDIELSTGVGEVEVTLPARVERGEVRISAGVGRITVIIPEGVAARIEAEAGLGNISVDERAFPKTDGSYRSQNYQDARYQLEISVSGGIGQIEIRSD